MPKGGKRIGAGRKPLNISDEERKKMASFRLTKKEAEQVRQFIKEIRK